MASRRHRPTGATTMPLLHKYDLSHFTRCKVLILVLGSCVWLCNNSLYVYSVYYSIGSKKRDPYSRAMASRARKNRPVECHL